MVVNATLFTIAVSGQECTDTVGSLSYDNNFIPAGKTFILAEYTIPCRGTVVAWEFCYQISGGMVTIYPGIWRITGTSGNSGNTDYTLVQSNTVTYDQSKGDTPGLAMNIACQRFNISDTDQFTAPAGSVVGLYSIVVTTVYINTEGSITNYQFSGNQSIVRINDNRNNVNYNIAIRVHLGKN